jgi:hypothetical protein
LEFSIRTNEACLGLSIETETAVLYGGSVVLGDAELGGLRAQLRLPAIA